MKRTKRRFALCIALLTLILGFIWGNSALPGEESGELSGGLLAFLAKLIPFVSAEDGEHILRKLAHFSEFAALGLCLCWLFGMLRKRTVWAVLCGAAVACVDESIQLFVPGRHGCVSDAVLDTAGVVTGVLLLGLYYWRKRT